MGDNDASDVGADDASIGDGALLDDGASDTVGEAEA